MSADRTRLQLVVDNGTQMKLGWALRYHAQRLLIDSDVAMVPGETVTVTPLCDDDTLDMREIQAVVMHQYCDETPNRPELRYMTSLLVDAGPQLHAALREAIDRSCLASLRRGPRDQTHGPDVLNTARWA